jgi:ABC-type nitrate/sulfonate/bicarbonate transport system permease component
MFWAAIADTTLTWLIGLLIAAGLGLGLGALIGAVPFLREVTTTTVEFLRPIPSVALIPLAVSMYGTGRPATLMIVICASFWLMFMQASYGVHDVDAVAKDTVKTYKLGRLSRVRYLTWPTILPYVMTGFRLASSVALILTITGELIIGTPGIGRRIAEVQTAANYPEMYALILITGVMGLLLNIILRASERKVLRWHPSVRLEALL